MLNPEIIFEDSEIIVFNKPSGMVVNKSDTFSGITLQDIVQERLHITNNTQESAGESDNEADIESDVSDNDEATPYESEFESRSGIVHRIDKDTSGVIIVAKNKNAFTNLQKQFKTRVVEKEYRAISIGKALDMKMEIDAPIGRNPHNRQMLAVVAGGRESQTYVEVLRTINVLVGESGVEFTEFLVKPHTGRTHQIRVHLAAANYPIAADPIYCTRKQYELSVNVFPRLMLHAYKIKFNHPVTGESLEFEAPLPEEFTKVS